MNSCRTKKGALKTSIRQATSHVGGYRTYMGRLGKDRSARESRHSVASTKWPSPRETKLISLVVRFIAIGGVNVGHTPSAIRGPSAMASFITVKIRESSTRTATYCLLTTVVSNTATSPPTLTFMEAPALTVQ